MQDPDMLIIGNFGLSYEQSKTQMALCGALLPMRTSATRALFTLVLRPRPPVLPY